MTEELRPLIDPPRIIQATSSFLKDVGKDNPHLAKLLAGCAAGAEELSGTSVILTLLEPGTGVRLGESEERNTGVVEFNSFEITDGVWHGVFSKPNEGSEEEEKPFSIPVGNFIVE